MYARFDVPTNIMNYLQTHSLELQVENRIVSLLTETIFSFQDKIKVFQRDILARKFSHFPNLSRRVNTFPDIEIKPQTG